MLLAAVSPAFATVFATVNGVVHDPQHRPVAGAGVKLKASESDFTLHATTGSEGGFVFANVPIGTYRLEVNAAGFARVSQSVTIASGTNPVLHIPLELAASTQSVVVHAADTTAPDTVTPTTLISREQIETTPGASRTLGMQMITDYVPGSYVTHDMLHVRGGHQTSWLIDGISIPNTKIASNLGPQIDPKDIDQLEVQRGSYAADVGDRTYGVFDVLPRNGFEFNRQGELLVSGGSFKTGEAQLSLGDHSAKTAWYASATGSRADYGLQTPVAEVLHDATNSGGGFLTLIRNQSTQDQLRLTAQYRQDFFQVPYDPNPDDWQQTGYYASYGLRDGQTERDSFVMANWVHTLSPKALFEVAPFWHFNQANYDSKATDLPVATTWHQTSNYAGAQMDARMDWGPNNLSGGLYSFAQWENDLYGLQVNDGSGPSEPNTPANTTAGIVEGHLSDHLHLGRYVTMLGGVRISSYHAGLDESAVYPRVGATAEIPHLHWVLRGFYGRFFQPAPVLTVSSSMLNYVQGNPNGPNTFIPVPSERDEEHQFGILIPWRGWALDVDTFRNRVNNFLDHANVGESNLYFPIAVDGALVRAWEMTLRSPQIAGRGQFHLAYSNQIAEQRGAVTGGYTCSLPNDPACNGGPDYKPVDHDQRHTMNTGFNLALPARTWFASNVYYGSGFVNGLAGSGVGPYQGAYLPAHTTFDVSGGWNVGENWKVSASVLNVTNHRVLLDNSVTVGGFHYNDPRIITGELRYRFRF
jgi:TonB dependent receptor/Carboxypeptidase regulatory-like domain/TonB-dependent Receptor Plug Domain